MNRGSWQQGVLAIERLANVGLDGAEFRRKSLLKLRSLITVDAAFFAAVDPATLLFTAALAEDPLASATSLFLENEFGRDDVNKFARLANAGDAVGTLDHATHGDRASSARYRDVMRPLGLGDELRVALGSGGRCWGVLCLHREDSELGFTEPEISLLRRLAPRLGEGLRKGVALHPPAPDASASDGPGVIVLDPDLSVVSINPQAQRWLAGLEGAEWPAHLELPMPIYAVAAQAIGNVRDGTSTPTATRLRSAAGWTTAQASPLNGAAGQQIAVILDAATASQLSSLVLAAHGLTAAQGRVVALVLQGRSTRSIVAELHISSHTVQEHLRAVFEKLGIGSRRELVAVLSGPR